MPIGWRRRASGAGAVLLIAAGTVAMWTDIGPPVAQAVGMWSAIAGVVLAYLAWRHPRAAPTDPVEAAVTALARAQQEQWRDERHARLALDPYPLPVRWSATPRAREVMASWSAVRGTPDAAPIALDGSYDTIADLCTGADAPRRLVVLGEPGAGKSMLVMHLTVELLDRREAGAPVPVLLAVAGWEPATPLAKWIAERIAAEHRSLARPVRAPDGSERSMASELLATGRILPILDGLDEIAAGRHEAALAGVAASSGRLVLTCRTAWYGPAVDAHGPLPGTAVIELLPLRPSDVAAYLVAGVDRPRPRWDPVLAHLTDGAATPVTEALTTPLTAWLARSAYHRQDDDPAELLRAGATRADLERHLLGRLVPAVYAARTVSWPARQADDLTVIRRRLAYIARHLRERRTYDLEWWDLHRVFPRARTPLAAGLAFGLVLGLLYAVGGVAAVGTPTAPLVGMLVLLMSGDPIARPLRRTMIVYLGLLLAAFQLVIATDNVWVVLLAVLVIGSAAGIAVGRAAVEPRRIVVTARGVVQSLVLLVCGVAVAVAGAELAGRVAAGAGAEGSVAERVALALAGVVLSFVPFALVVSRLARGLVRTADDGQRAVTPLRLLDEDRAAGLLLTLAVATVFVVVDALRPALYDPAQLRHMPIDSVETGVVVAIVFGAAVATLSPWGRFCVLRVVLAARGRTPWRLMAFLREAHDRGVLRQSGGAYQFRHSRIQDHLADRP